MSRTASSVNRLSWTADGNRADFSSVSNTRPTAGSGLPPRTSSPPDWPRQSVPMRGLASDRTCWAFPRIESSMMALLDLCVGEAAAQLAPDRDRGDVEQHDDPDQEERRREHDGFRRLAVRALEPEIVDVEPEVHEAALGVDERRDA